MRSMDNRKGSAGFSLLEMVVAISILAFSLAALYQAAAGATRNVRVDEKYAYAVELARSLLADNSIVPLEGTSARGKTAGGYSWRVTSNPVNLSRSSMSVGTLHTIEIGVGWNDGSKSRELVLNSVVEGRAR